MISQRKRFRGLLREETSKKELHSCCCSNWKTSSDSLFSVSCFNQRKAKAFLNTTLLVSPGAKKKNNNNKYSDKTESQSRERRAHPLRPHAHTDPLTTTCTTTTPLLCVCPRKTFKKTPKANRHNKRYKASITREKRKKNITKTSQRFKSFPQEKKKPRNK